jgi:Right handed beta helix region
VLKTLNPDQPNTVTVSGTCNENLQIEGFDRLKLISTSGASINDKSGGLNPVIYIADSRSVTVQGFAINGGNDGVMCDAASVCYLTGNNIQSSVGQEGVAVITGSHGFLANNVIQNNAQRGLTANDGSQVSSSNDKFVGNVSSGIFMNSGAYLAATNSVIQNNGTDGSDATVVADHSTLGLIACTVSGNLQNGVSLQRSSEARFDSPSIVNGNGGTGVSVRDLSFAVALLGSLWVHSIAPSSRQVQGWGHFSHRHGLRTPTRRHLPAPAKRSQLGPPLRGKESRTAGLSDRWCNKGPPSKQTAAGRCNDTSQ